LKTIRCLMLAAAVALTGCAANVVKNPSPGAQPVRVPAESAKNLMLNIGGSPTAAKSADWAAFRGEWRNAVAAEASAAAIPFNMQDGDPKPTGQTGTLVSVYVNDYHYVSSGARFGLGIMTGNAYVDAKIRFLDLKTGQPFGEQVINTSSSAWQGIFSAMTDKQLQAIAKEIVNDIKPR
jgi:hypothetical protein